MEGPAAGESFISGPSSSRLGRYKTAAISCDGAPCSAAGRDILADGGNAMDAAIGALFCNAVVNPQSAGLGGGFHLTVYDPVKRMARCLDARETAPMAATENMFRDDLSLSQKGGLAVAVPGELAGYWAAHRAYGRLPWSRLIQPAVAMAENGVSVNCHLAEALKREAESIKSDPSMRMFLDDNGQPLRLGDTYKMPVLAATLKQVARLGVETFYDGAIGDKMIQDVRARGGILTREDLRQYRAEWVDPVEVKLNNNLTLYSTPPPGSGLLTAYIMRQLDGHLQPSDVSRQDPLTYHRIVEAFKHAFGQRTKLGDPKFHPQVNEVTKMLLSDGAVTETRSKFKATSTSDDPTFYGAVHYTPPDKGTSHVSVLDADGMAVSVTSTINLHFGAGFASEQTGIILNNEMADFSPPRSHSFYGLPPSPANLIRPGKRPLSSMTPVIVVDSGRVRLVIGAAGGIRITTSTAYAIIRNLWLGEDIKKAIDSPRFHHQLFPMTLQYEKAFPKATLDELSNKGHRKSEDKSGAAVYGISVESDGYLYAYADYRKGGDVAGF